MELNLIIEGDRKAAFELATRIERMPHSHPVRSSLAINLEEFKLRTEMLKRIDRKINKPDLLVFYNISSANMLLRAVDVIKQYRSEVAKPVTAIMACDCGVVCLTEYREPYKASPSEILEGNYFKIDGAPIEACSDRASLAYVKPEGEVFAEHKRYPLTWDNKQQAFQAADLEADGQVVCSAVNVYAFEGALRNGIGKRSKVSMLFELAEVVPVSGLHVAVDKMNTHYFATGTFKRRAFNKSNVRPAQPAEVLEYLNAKYAYLSSIENEKV